MSALKKFAGQTAIYGLSTILSRMMAFLLTPIYSRTIPVAGNGILTTLYSGAAIMNAILALGMETTFFRYLQKREDNKQVVYNNAFGAIIAISTIFLLFSLLFLDKIILFIQSGSQDDYSDYSFYIKCFLIILVIDALCVIPFAKIRADVRPVRYGIIKTLNILIMLSLNLFFLFGIPFIISHNLPGAQWVAEWYRPNWVGYVFLSNMTASIITLLLLLPEVLILKLKFDAAMFKDMFIYSWPVLIANISFLINESFDKVMLNYMLPSNISEHEVGIYGMCAKIALFLSIFINAFRLGAEPFFFSHAKNKNSADTYARIMNYFVIAVGLIAVALIANINFLATFIVGSEYDTHLKHNVYWTGLGVVPPLLFGYLSLGIYITLSIWYKLSDQTRYGLYISGIGAVLTILLNWVFIPLYSYMASAWVSFTAYSVMMVLSYVWGQKNYPIPYNLKRNLAYIVSSVIVVTLSFVVFKRDLVAGNILFILFLAGTVYIERKELKQLFT